MSFFNFDNNDVDSTDNSSNCVLDGYAATDHVLDAIRERVFHPFGESDPIHLGGVMNQAEQLLLY